MIVCPAKVKFVNGLPLLNICSVDALVVIAKIMPIVPRVIFLAVDDRVRQPRPEPPHLGGADHFPEISHPVNPSVCFSALS